MPVTRDLPSLTLKVIWAARWFMRFSPTPGSSWTRGIPLRQLGLLTDAGQHQDMRRLERPGAQHHRAASTVKISPPLSTSTPTAFSP